jgi:CPA1 family monovalent cation:H+ antiporter
MAPLGRRTEACEHVPKAFAQPRSDVCEECGSDFNLRVCTECGHVGCCESQLGHNTAHYHQTGHAVIKSLPLGSGSFTWCYEHRRYV